MLTYPAFNKPAPPPAIGQRDLMLQHLTQLSQTQHEQVNTAALDSRITNMDYIMIHNFTRTSPIN